MSKMTDTLSISAPADFHVHLRQGSLCSLVTSHVSKGGFKLAYVMVSYWSSDTHSNSDLYTFSLT